jgi:hypothetical protein
MIESEPYPINGKGGISLKAEIPRHTVMLSLLGYTSLSRTVSWIKIIMLNVIGG